MTSSKKHNTIENSESGVTLIISVIFAATILAIAFSLAAIAYKELQASSDLVRTEKAVYGAQASLEEALFKIKRGIYTFTTNKTGIPIYKQPDNCSNPGGCTTNKVTYFYPVTTGGVVEPLVATVPAYSKLDNSSAVYYLIDPDPTHSILTPAYYTKVKAQNISDKKAKIMVCGLTEDSTTCLESNTNFPSGVPGSGNRRFYEINPGATSPDIVLDVTGNYIVFLYNSDPTQSVPGYLRLYAKGQEETDPVNDPGVYGPEKDRPFPYFLSVGVDVTATYNNLVRKYRAIIPLQ